MEQDHDARVKQNVSLVLTDRLKEIWITFMEEFQQSFNVKQLDTVLSMLRELDSTSQNSIKKKRLEFVQKGDGESVNNNNESSSLEKKVFGNHLLAKSIFKHLRHSDLFSCRLMNSYWNENATEVLLNSDYFKITFRKNINRFYLNKSNWKSLDMFTQLLRTSKQFPCNKFVFEGGNLGNDDAQRFFSLYGSSIKFIEISFSDGQVYNTGLVDNEKGFSPYLTESRVIGMILSQHLPNLEHLELELNYQGDYEWTGFDSLLFPLKKEVKLPNLKSLNYNLGQSGDDFLLRQLLVAAPNLFKLKSDIFQVDKLDNFTKTGKVKYITDLWFPTDTEELDKLEEMVGHEPKLTDLYLENLNEFCYQPETWKKISIILTNLLESCKNSINTIDRFDSLGFLPKLQLPVLQNVTNLHLEVINESTFNSEDIHEYSFAFLPRGATFSRNFPRLHSVGINFESKLSSEDESAWWTKCFPTDDIVPTVKKLDINWYSCPILWMEKFSEMFPNLENLSISGIKDFPNFSKIIWTSFRKLKSLEVGIALISPLNAHPALDSSFTGLSPEVCKTLETFSLPLLESIAEDYMENEPSLLDLTELQSLQINLHFSMSLENYKYPKVLSPLTGICVFKPLKKLREVNIKCSTLYKQQLDESLILRNLEPLTPYKVKIEVKK